MTTQTAIDIAIEKEKEEKTNLCMFCNAKLTNDDICNSCDLLQTDPYAVDN